MAESIVFIQGKPGAGKSTTSRHAVETSRTWAGGLPTRHLSVGERFRAILNGDCPSQHESAVREAVSSRPTTDAPASIALPSFMLVHHLVAEYLEEQRQSPGITLIDGYPKELELVHLIARQQREGVISVKGIIELHASDKTAVERQLGRRGVGCAHPEYDASVALSRVEHHSENARPVIQELSKLGVLLSMDGEQPLDTVHKEFVQLLRALCQQQDDLTG